MGGKGLKKASFGVINSLHPARRKLIRRGKKFISKEGGGDYRNAQYIPLLELVRISLKGQFKDFFEAKLNLVLIIAPTVCPRSSNPFYLVSYYMKWVITAWTYSIVWNLPQFSYGMFGLN